MKKLILFSTVLCSLLSSNALFAANLDWSDLELDNIYTLKQDVVFENGITFKSGEKFNMADFMAGEIPVMYFEMFYTGCTDYSATADLVLMDVPQAQGRAVVIGAQLYEGCNLGIYLVPRDFYKKSIFE